MGAIQRFRGTGKLHLDLSPQVVKTRANTICTGPRSKEVKRREGKEEISKVTPSSISPLPEYPAFDHPISHW
jgi:hypothetical protein